MGPRHGNPKTALERVGTIVAGASFGGVCLVAEERRRQLAFAQNVIENGKRLHKYKTYQTLAPVEIFDQGRWLDLPPVPIQEQQATGHAKQEDLPLLADPHTGRQLSNLEWKTMRRKHRPLPHASPTTLHTASPLPLPTDILEHWDTVEWRTQHETQAFMESSSGSMHNVEPAPRKAPREHDGQEVQELNQPSAQAREVVESPSLVGSPSFHLRSFEDGTPSMPVDENDSKTPAVFSSVVSKSAKYAEDLQNTVANHVISCLETDDKRWVARGLKELRSYFKDDVPILAESMNRAIVLAGEKSHPDSQMRHRLADLRAQPTEPLLSSILSISPPLDSGVQSDVKSVQHEDQTALARHISDLVHADQAYEAFFAFKAFCDHVRQPLESALSEAISKMIFAFKDMYLFSVVNEIRQQCLHKLKEWRFVIKDVHRLLLDEPLSRTPNFIHNIFRQVLELDLDQDEKKMVLAAMVKCQDLFEKAGNGRSALRLRIDLLEYSSVKDRAKLGRSTLHCIETAIRAQLLDEVHDLAHFGFPNEKGLTEVQVTIERTLLQMFNSDTQDLFLDTFAATIKHPSEIYQKPIVTLVSDILTTATPHQLDRVLDIILASNKRKTIDYVVPSYQLALHAGRYSTCAQLISSLNLEGEGNARVADNLLHFSLGTEARVKMHRAVCPTVQQQRSYPSEMLQGLLRIASAYQLDDAKQALLKLLRGESPLSVDNTKQLISGHYHDGRLAEVNDLNNVLGSSSDLPDNCQIMLLHAKHRHDADAFQAALTDEDRSLEILPVPALNFLLSTKDQEKHTTILHILISRLHDLGAHEQVLDLWYPWAGKLTAMGQAVISPILEAFAQVGPLPEAVHFLDNLTLDYHEQEISRIQNAHKVLLSRCWKTTRNIAMTKQILAKQLSMYEGRLVDIELFNAAILACIEANDLEAAQDLADKISAFDLNPDMGTYSLQILADGRRGYWNQVETTLKDLHTQTKFQPRDSFTLDRAIVEYCRQHTAQESIAFIKRIPGLRITQVVGRAVTEKIVDEEHQDLFEEWTAVLGAKVDRSVSHSAFTLMMHRALQSPMLKRSSSLATISWEDIATFKDEHEMTDLINGSHRSPRENQQHTYTIGSRDHARVTERSMLRDIGRGDAQAALSRYRFQLQQNLPSSQVDLRLAITAACSLAIPDGEWLNLANSLISDASRAGLNTYPIKNALAIRKFRALHALVDEDEAARLIRRFYHDASATRDRTNTHLPIALARNLLHRKMPRAALRVMEVAEYHIKAAGGSLDIPAYTLLISGFAELRQAEGIRWVIRKVLEHDLRIDPRMIQILQVCRRQLRRTKYDTVHLSATGETPASEPLLEALDEAIPTLHKQRNMQKNRAMDFARHVARTMLKYTPHRRDAVKGGHVDGASLQHFKHGDHKEDTLSWQAASKR